MGSTFPEKIPVMTDLLKVFGKMQSYKDVLDEVMPIFHKNPDRFMRFYHAVNNILAAIPTVCTRPSKPFDKLDKLPAESGPMVYIANEMVDSSSGV